MRLRSHRLILAIILLCGTSAPAFAYIDPGTGSMLLQGAIGVVAGALVACKVYWSKLVALFSGRPQHLSDTGPKDTK